MTRKDRRTLVFLTLQGFRTQHRILIVDDDPDVAQSLRDLLSGIPETSLTVAGTLREGLTLLRSGEWAVVIADQRLPDGAGLMLLQAALQEQPGAKRVLMTAYHDAAVNARAINEAHVHVFVQKPWEPQRLERDIHRLLEPFEAVELPTPERIPPLPGTWPSRR